MRVVEMRDLAVEGALVMAGEQDVLVLRPGLVPPGALAVLRGLLGELPLRLQIHNQQQQRGVG
jgi:hypothetical protein